jgi:hypothetical protein
METRASRETRTRSKKNRACIAAIVGVITMGIAAGVALGSCGPSMQNTVTMRCGETQTTTIGSHKCVVVTAAEGDCPVKVEVACEGESSKSTVVQGSGKTGKLCCNHKVGQVRFTAVGDSSGTCEFTYGRSD